MSQSIELSIPATKSIDLMSRSNLASARINEAGHLEIPEGLPIDEWASIGDNIARRAMYNVVGWRLVGLMRMVRVMANAPVF